VGAYSFGSCGAPRQRGFDHTELLSVQISQQETKTSGIDVDSGDAAAVGFKAEHIRRTASARFAFADRFDQTRCRKMRHNVGDTGSAQARSPHQICPGARAGFPQQLQDVCGVGLTQQGRPANQNGFFGQCSLPVSMEHKDRNPQRLDNKRRHKCPGRLRRGILAAG
jgi:hypothetical protein